jgi:hypothetical protein
MGNKSIYLIRIKDDLHVNTWYTELNGWLFYVVKTIIKNKINWEVINNEQLNGSLIQTAHADILEIITKVVLPMY